MTGDPTPEASLSIYVCPICKGPLVHADESLLCATCSQTYPIRDGIPDFLKENLARSQDPELRRMTMIDRMAKIYESKLWYSVVLAAYGGFESPSLPQLIAKVTQKLESVHGRVIDIACGPGTYGRRVATPSREVFGIDVSMGMLGQGVAYCAEEGIPNMQFARARVEALPFADDLFDAALCCGSLHLFTDTIAALREIARVTKPGAILSVFTFTAGRSGALRFPKFREWSRRHGLHIFELPEMEQYLADSGFADFCPEVTGSILTFTARRLPAQA
jgi:ubiquinone/menaquinone biosynthesis C-methylase UbiE